jgi:acyl-homoserine lactone acylase PvdQ
MALSFTEGSIGGDYERIDTKQLAEFYGGTVAASVFRAPRPVERLATGSNGIAISPANTLSHHALLLINPHTTFYFRSELQVASDEGLNAYGAVTWGQFFVYQGFNSHAGWMHTSSGVDAVDEYLETVSRHGDAWSYKYGSAERGVTTRTIVIPYRTPSGMAERQFTVFATHHGPIVRKQGDKWVSIRLMQKHIDALSQSYLRTKAAGYPSYLKTMEFKANSSNNTVFADTDGDIAYFHGNFIPRRNPRFDWTKPVDGSNPATEWKGLLPVWETPHLLNPRSGWLYNSNNWPWSGAGDSSLRRQDFPPYVETGGESARGLHAIRVLRGKHDFTLDSLIAAAYDSYLTWFDKPLPALIHAWEQAAATDPLKQKLAEPVAILRAWDHRWAVDSVATSLVIFWGTQVWNHTADPAARSGLAVGDYVADKIPPSELLRWLDVACHNLESSFRKWKTPWGEINRLQRINDSLTPSFRDEAPSIPVGFTWSRWGSLASFEAKPYPGTKKWYGNNGNSFVAVVEFGPRVHAKAVTVGGESGHPGSRHFNDESQRYASGALRDVYFYADELKGHTERTYHPGSEPARN